MPKSLLDIVSVNTDSPHEKQMSTACPFQEAKAADFQELASISIHKEYGIIESTFCQTTKKGKFSD